MLDEFLPAAQHVTVPYANNLRELVERSRRRSAVFDVITGSVPVTIDVNNCLSLKPRSGGRLVPVPAGRPSHVGARPAA